MLRSRQNVNFARFHAICYSQTRFFQKWILCKSACLADAKMMKSSQKFKISTFLDFFDHFESFQDARSVFYFWIFREFGVPDHEIWQNPWFKIHSQLRHLFQGFASFLPYTALDSWLYKNTSLNVSWLVSQRREKANKLFYNFVCGNRP